MALNRSFSNEHNPSEWSDPAFLESQQSLPRTSPNQLIAPPPLVPIRAQNKEHLIGLISSAMAHYGNKVSLNHIDVGSITNMSMLFADLRGFNGDISEWDVSNVTSMHGMFMRSSFQGDVSKWNVANVKDMAFMFAYTHFSGDLSHWNVASVQSCDSMFLGSTFEGSVSRWDVRRIVAMSNMFSACSFRGDLSHWKPERLNDCYFFMDAQCLRSSEQPSYFYWRDIQKNGAGLPQEHPWVQHYNNVQQLADLAGITNDHILALMAQKMWNHARGLDLYIPDTLDLPDLGV